MSAPYALILYYSRSGSVANLAKEIAHGCEAAGLAAKRRTVPPVGVQTAAVLPAVPTEGAPYCTAADLQHCSALALGSPSRFGNIAAPLKFFLEEATELWLDGALIGKPAGVFTSSSTMHGGQESTLLSMMVPLLHHGMLITGIPFSEAALNNTTTGGTPYGPSHVAGLHNNTELSADEKALARAFGQRLATTALALHKRS